MDELSAADWDVVDQGLSFLYREHERIVDHLAPGAFQPVSRDILRTGPLGAELAHLARISRGAAIDPTDDVDTRIESVMQLLFWPPGADDFAVPRSFWDTDLGRVIMAAKFRSSDQSDLMTIGEAADLMQVTRQRIYRSIDDRALSYVRDDQTGRTFVYRSEVARLRDEPKPD